MDWNKIDVDVRNSAYYNVFKIKFIRLELNQVFNVDSSEGLKFITRIRFDLSTWLIINLGATFKIAFPSALITITQEKLSLKK